MYLVPGPNEAKTILEEMQKFFNWKAGREVVHMIEDKVRSNTSFAR
jgi:hypothetical protein